MSRWWWVMTLGAVACGGASTPLGSGPGGADAGDDSGGTDGAGSDALPVPPTLTWTVVSVPLSSPVTLDTDVGANPLWGSGPGDVYVATYDGLLHLRSGSWVNEIADHQVTGAWGSAANDVFALTSTGVMHSAGDGVWTMSDPVSATSDQLNAIWGAGPNDVFVVGSGNIYHFNGTAWQRRPMAVATTELSSIWGSGSKDVYVAGPLTAFISTVPGQLLHYDGSSWTDQSVPQSQTLGGFGALWGSSASDIYLGANAPTSSPSDILFHSGGAGQWSSQLKSDQGPSTFDTPSNAGIWAIWGSQANDVYATTFGLDWTAPDSLRPGMVLHSAGDGVWAPVAGANALTEDPVGVWGSGPADVYVGTKNVDTGGSGLAYRAPRDRAMTSPCRGACV